MKVALATLKTFLMGTGALYNLLAEAIDLSLLYTIGEPQTWPGSIAISNGSIITIFSLLLLLLYNRNIIFLQVMTS